MRASKPEFPALLERGKIKFIKKVNYIKMKEEILKVNNIKKSFNGFLALNYVSLSIENKTINTIIGPNGAGKTTFFNAITGFTKIDEGNIIYKGKDITNSYPFDMVKYKISRSFQIINNFPKLSVLENIISPILISDKIKNIFSRNYKKYEKDALEILNLIGLIDKKDEIAGNLPYGDQRVLEIGIAIANRPELLLLDEPTSGVGPNETKLIIEIIRKLYEYLNLTIIIIEHDMDFVFEISQRIIVMNEGKIIADGLPEKIKYNEEVRKVYLGDEK